MRGDFLIQGRSATEAAVQPETRYVRLGSDRIAYQVLGQGPPDLVMTTGGFSQIEIIWEDPGIALFLRTLASFSRLILFDRRGTGASDPLPPDPLPPWESYAEELAVVLDEVGSERAALLAQIDAGPLALYFAASRPERTSALILAHTTARFVATDDYPIGVPADVAETLLVQVDQLWGSEVLAGILMPSRAGDERFLRWFAKLQRTGASPRAAKALLRAALEVDARPILPLIHASTLILHRRDAHLIPIQHARFLAEHIPDAKLVELRGSDLSLMWETREQILDLIEEFLTGVRRVPPPKRVLATVLFTDIVGSTTLASRLRDRRWRELLDTHDDVSRQTVEEFNGRLVETTGDGILATFDGPGRGIGCAAALRDHVRGIGLQLREGLHTGEVELRNGHVGGVGVHIAARVMDAARPGEILASRTVRDLVVGSDVILEDRGIRRLKGVDGRWQLYAVTRP
jgi:class 3 adenylate cyclase